MQELPNKLKFPHVCPNCRLEYREGFDTRADCKVALVDKLSPRETESTFIDPVVLLETSQPETVALAESLLRGAGFEYWSSKTICRTFSVPVELAGPTSLSVE